MFNNLPSYRPISVNNDIIPLNIHYALEINGIQWGTFDRIYGGDMEFDVIQHQIVYESGEFVTLHIPGPSRTTPVTLESGVGNTAALYAWFQQVQKGDINGARKNATVTLNSHIDGKYQPVIQWHLINAWPSKIGGFDFGQYQTERVRFMITLVCEAIEREDFRTVQ